LQRGSGRPIVGEDSVLRQAWQGGRERWPEVRLSLEDFVAHVTALRSEGDAPNPGDLSLHGDDMFLVAACVAGDIRALSVFECSFMAELPKVVSAIDPAPAFGAEVAQLLRERLLCPPLERLRHYSATGSLAGWLRVAAKRLAVDLKRREGVSLRQTGELATVVANASHGPEWELVRRRFRKPLEAALCAALDALPARERMVLRLYLLRGENIDAIGKIYGVHRATVARWIVAAQRSIITAVTTRLQDQFGFSAGECHSLARDLKSSLEFTLERLL
jgi:RNA polymerase sigma-70 factor, ECF subfamily